MTNQLYTHISCQNPDGCETKNLDILIRSDSSKKEMKYQSCNIRDY